MLVTLCGILGKSDIDSLLYDIQKAWQTSQGGIGLNSVQAAYVSQQEFLSDDV